MPRTHGQPGIPFSALTAFVEAVEPLAGTDADEDADPVAMAIARHIAPWVRNGATLQTGLGTQNTAPRDAESLRGAPPSIRPGRRSPPAKAPSPSRTSTTIPNNPW